jgi:hypothetical protein
MPGATALGLCPECGACRRGSLAAITSGFRQPRPRGPAPCASPHITAVPADTPASLTTVGHHLGDGQPDSAHPAGLDVGAQPGETQVLVISHDHLRIPRAHDPEADLKSAAANPASRLARQPYPAVWHASRAAGYLMPDGPLIRRSAPAGRKPGCRRLRPRDQALTRRRAGPVAQPDPGFFLEQRYGEKLAVDRPVPPERPRSARDAAGQRLLRLRRMTQPETRAPPTAAAIGRAPRGSRAATRARRPAMSCRACCSASAAAAGFSTASPAVGRLVPMSAHYPPVGRRNRRAPART